MNSQTKYPKNKQKKKSTLLKICILKDNYDIPLNPNLLVSGTYTLKVNVPETNRNIKTFCENRNLFVNTQRLAHNSVLMI